MEKETKQVLFIWSIIILAIMVGAMLGLLYSENNIKNNTNTTIIENTTISMDGVDFLPVNNTQLLKSISDRENSSHNRPFKIYAQEIDGNAVIIIPFWEKGSSFVENITISGNITVGN